MIAGLGLLLMAESGCKNDVSGPGSGDSNLIANDSFEPGEYPSFACWNLNDTTGNPPDIAVHFSNDVPLLGGDWSLKVTPDPSASREGFADFYVIGPVDKYVYRLAVWGKPLNGWDNGAIQFRLFSPGSNELRQSNPVNLDGWQYYTLEDTVQLYENDTLVVRLGAGSWDGNTGDVGVLYDEVSLQRHK